MMQSTWYLVLALAHVGLIVGLMLAESRRLSSWPSPAMLLGSGLLFAVAGIYATSLQVATGAGIKQASEPVVGVYALGAAFVALLLALIATIGLIPTSRGDRNGI
jgi:hypothetical protein